MGLRRLTRAAAAAMSVMDFSEDFFSYFLELKTLLAMSVMDPQELAAAPRATSLVFVSSKFSRWSRSRRQLPCLMFTLDER